MATYAVLGSTGNCGTALVQNLLESPKGDNIKINAYCRNRAKLERLLPEVVGDKRVRVFEGSIYDIDLIVDCVRGTRAVFLVASTNDNVPGIHVAQDCAASVIKALARIKTQSSDAQPGFKPPRLVLLSSSTVDDHLSRHMPRIFRAILYISASHVYQDVRMAEALIRSHDFWLSSVFIKPAGLSVDVGRGHRLDLDDDDGKNWLSYQDLAAGMIEAADDESGMYEGRNVAVVNKSKNQSAKFARGTPMCIILGLTRHFFPWLHPYLPSGGPA